MTPVSLHAKRSPLSFHDPSLSVSARTKASQKLRSDQGFTSIYCNVKFMANCIHTSYILYTYIYIYLLEAHIYVIDILFVCIYIYTYYRHIYIFYNFKEALFSLTWVLVSHKSITQLQTPRLDSFGYAKHPKNTLEISELWLSIYSKKSPTGSRDNWMYPNSVPMVFMVFNLGILGDRNP